MSTIIATIFLSKDVELFFGVPGAGDFILREDGSNLLREDGTNFLRE